MLIGRFPLSRNAKNRCKSRPIRPARIRPVCHPMRKARKRIVHYADVWPVRVDSHVCMRFKLLPAATSGTEGCDRFAYFQRRRRCSRPTSTACNPPRVCASEQKPNSLKGTADCGMRVPPAAFGCTELRLSRLSLADKR